MGVSSQEASPEPDADDDDGFKDDVEPVLSSASIDAAIKVCSFDMSVLAVHKISLDGASVFTEVQSLLGLNQYDGPPLETSLRQQLLIGRGWEFLQKKHHPTTTTTMASKMRSNQCSHLHR